MACPFFMPIEKLENGNWLHPGRLPLGCGWSGHCTAPGHENETPSHEELHHFCNLGYAEGCMRLPRDRSWDSVRFGARTLGDIGKNRRGQRIHVRYVCERGHLPADHGFLVFDPAETQWRKQHPDRRIQRMAECFLASYVESRKNQEVAQAAS